MTTKQRTLTGGTVLAPADGKVGKQLSVYPPLVTAGGGSASKSGKKEYERPDDNRYDDWVELYETDEIFGAAIDNMVDYICGSGVSVKLHSLALKGDEVNVMDYPEAYRSLRITRTHKLMKLFVKDALLNGTGYAEVVRTVRNSEDAPIYKFANVPPGKMRVYRDEHMTPLSYKQEIGGDNEPEFKPVNIIEYKYHEVTGKPYGCSVARRVIESCNILRNIGLDLAEFVSTKAFPPLLWLLGSMDKPWDRDEVTAFMAELDSIGPGKQIGVSGDIDAKGIGVNDTALDVSKPMDFFASKIINGMQLPSALSTVIEVSNQFVAETQMTAFDIFVTSIRKDLSELFEIEMIDALMLSHGYDDIFGELVFEPHNWEKERVDINNIIQLLNSKLYTIEYALHKLGDPVDEAQRGTFVQGSLVDPSGMGTGDGSTGTENDQMNIEKSNNKKEDVDDDGREGSRRSNVER